MKERSAKASRITEAYYADNARKLRYIADGILRKFGGIYQKDYDDFYSIANLVFVDALRQYDASRGSFEGLLKQCLVRKFQNELSRRNAKKQIPAGCLLSLDQPDGDGGKEPAIDGCSDFNPESVLSGRMALLETGPAGRYWAALSGIQRQILKMRMLEVPKYEILKRLRLSEKAYNRHFAEIKSFDRTRVLFQKTEKPDGQEDMTLKTTEMQTTEISKNTNYSIASYVKKLNNYTIRGDHSLQRNSNQWSSEQKYNLITTVLNRYPIPEVILAEQVKPYGVENWLIDGKQRLTCLSDYRNDVFRVGRNAERTVVQYQAPVRNEAGEILLGANGSPQYENREFDVRGKYYTDLPEELKERFNDYTISAVQYLSCSDDDIEYHIRRYNAAKPMSAAQKGITHLGEQYARVVKKLSQHPLFRDQSRFRISEFTNGTMDRVITESIMVIFFLSDWKKKQEDICAYLKENVKISHFEHFEALLNRLSEIVTDELSTLLNAKEAFVWFGLFDRFTKLGIRDEKFADFVRAFAKELHTHKIKGASYDDLNIKSTKDKSIVVRKLFVLETLLYRFLKIKGGEQIDSFTVPEGVLSAYIAEFQTMDMVRAMNIRPEADQVRLAVASLMLVLDRPADSDKKIQDFIRKAEITAAETEDTLFYLSCLYDWAKNVNQNAGILCQACLPALVKLVQYSCVQDFEDAVVLKWFEWYVENEGTGAAAPLDCRKLYEVLQQSLTRYVAYMNGKKAAAP